MENVKSVQGKDLSQFFKKKSKIKKNERHIYCESLLPTQLWLYTHFSEFLSRVSDTNASHSLEQYVVEAYHHLGMAFLQQEDFDQAVTYFSKALEIEVDSSKTYYNLGIIYHKPGKLDEAVTKYNKALDINPDFPEARYNLGNLLRELGKFDAAIVHYKEALRLKPGWEYAQRNLYIAETMKNKP